MARPSPLVLSLLAFAQVLSGPDGFIFPVNCTDGFRLRLSLYLRDTMGHPKVCLKMGP